MTEDKCKKCERKIHPYDDSPICSIASCLCENCWRLWKHFNREYSDAIKKKYFDGKNGHHASWSVFIGELPNEWGDKAKEKVEFT